MTKKEAIERLVQQDLNGIPQEWVKKIVEAEGDFVSLPMWGTMWIIDDHIGERLMAHSRLMVSGPSEIERENCDSDEEWERVQKAIKEDDWTVLENYIDEEMSGEHCVMDGDGGNTAMYIYEIDGRYVLGVNGAGWNFYDGAWDKLYDILGLQWHDETK